MKISVNIVEFKKYGNHKQILKLIKDSGFDAYDFAFHFNEDFDRFIESEDYAQRAQELRKFADELGIVCNQSHAPFPPIITGNDRYNKETQVLIERAFETSAILGSRQIVIHISKFLDFEQNLELCNTYLPYAKKYKVKIAIENLYTNDRLRDHMRTITASHHDEFYDFMQRLDKNWFVACVDTGHAGLYGINSSPYCMIKKLGNYVQALHLHSNDGIRDLHQLPFLGVINFDEIIKALKEIKYKCDITLEVKFSRFFPIDMYPQTAKFIAQVANNIRKKVQEQN